MEEAVKLFDEMPEPTVTSWNTMIHGFNYNRLFESSWLWSRKMCHSGSEPDEISYRSVLSACVAMQRTRFGKQLFLMPNGFTFSSVLTACAALNEVGIGKEVQGWIVKCGAEDVFVGTALIDLYVKCGGMDEAVKTFSWMPMLNVASWTAIISGFVQTDGCVNALELFKEMRYVNVEINSYTATAVISACAKLNMIEEAMQIHSLIIKSGFFMHSVIQAALVNMYSKIGFANMSE
ncbi:hypothetical protein F3Y22_tig00113724pilonHSYRG00270 [Hibiscus syriacus]|uniref:Pentatricopeptide repeat-containing protein n=1 Tax=Hibiscus syriacus TaxID=106335 RepID=A0A6A2WMZ3_HIBSY|nr:hypothetical protein F3Y22_tig00113724pilonHSYRG00270 [Hibiscus syriacus]